MNIIHLEDEPWDSGIAHYAVTLAVEQSRRGHAVSFWGREGSPALEQAAKAGLPARGVASGLQGWLGLPALRREAAALKPSVLNAHTGSSHVLALLLAPKGAVVIRTRGDARLVKANPLTRFIASRTAAFIAANSALKASLAAAFPKTPVRLVPQGIECGEDAAPMPGMPFVGLLGRLDAVKGHGVLLDAAQILKPLFPGLRILCAGEGRLLDRLRWQLKPQALDTTVYFLGRVADKWAFLSGCRVGVVASTGSEAVSRAALEWMASARPLVAARVGGLPDLVEDGVTGLLVPPGDAKALADALGSLLADPKRAEAMGRAARARWEERFSLGPFYHATQTIYEKAIDPLPPRR